MNTNQTIALYQPVLQQIALKMVGSIADAEDIVQDTFLKWLTVNHEKIENTKAYLIRAVTNNSLNHLDALKRKKNECLQNIKPAELIDWYKEKDLFHFDMENEVSAALDIIHKKLEPVEKGIYVLREFFNFEYEELQHIFDKKKDNCRQLFSRAKDKLTQETGKIKLDLPQTHFIENFKKACHIGSPADFIKGVKQEILEKLEGKSF
ncbi:sigma-70 family RNA polymerase sigma factor [Fulvivirga maritima]|uniref:sigma-70 family RNA polymerase sigma factor n=1 Tax=Fulvivirga maritima TaxID=2904247 RepID=UPI001F2B91B9|nr:sigma-70 family RNA polymerase sigma factor [Fulvivirga maritima]UII29283.1 sigma-70 family RNA polymerase sigma factor [Fulvivirga maritima]